MAGSTFGQLFRVTTAGESHGPANLAIVDGCPPGLPLDEADIQPELDRRRPGQSSITSPRAESDRVEILSGVFEGQTMGTPIALLIRNQDARTKDYEAIKDLYRPGHADYPFDRKFGVRDWRGGGRSSARETTARVAAGAIAQKLLRHRYGVQIVGWVSQIGSICAPVSDPTQVTRDQVEQTPVRCPDPVVAAAMVALIEEMRHDRDSVGGAATFCCSGVPAGWGEPVFDKLKALLGSGLLSLPAVMGFEYGAGFSVVNARGSQNNDAFVADSQGRVTTRTNHHGGVLGGISTGLPIIFRCAVKPTSSLPRPQDTVDREGRPTTVSTKGRHDPCLLPRFIPMGEAMAALVLADLALRQEARGG